jgi:gamma-glutamylcyclotransferase
MTLIFAYGSNMDWGQMRERCPSAEFVGVAKLTNHHLAFTRKSKNRGCGVSDVLPVEGQDVWGVVYQIPEAEMSRLDSKEGINSKSYVRRVGTVDRDGDESKPMAVEIYFAVPQDKPPLPNQEYKNLIVSGAKHWNLPANYIAELENIKVAQ